MLSISMYSKLAIKAYLSSFSETCQCHHNRRIIILTPKSLKLQDRDF